MKLGYRCRNHEDALSPDFGSYELEQFCVPRIVFVPRLCLRALHLQIIPGGAQILHRFRVAKGNPYVKTPSFRSEGLDLTILDL